MRETWDTSCKDWAHRLLNGLPLVPDLKLNTEEAGKALRCFKRLRLPDVMGRPTMEEACGEWYLAIVAALFGSYDPVLQRRHIQEFFLMIPKKNAKSSSGGATMLLALIMNHRPEAEFLLVAPTKEIADIAFKQASGTIKCDPNLEKAFHIQRHLRLITKRDSEAKLQIKAADTDVITGSKALGTMIDETHVFAARARAAEVFVELRGALASKPDGFLFQTTTQSKAPPSGVFKTELQTARDVRDGKIRLPLLPILYELPHHVAKDNGWRNKALWPLVNPNMGRSVDADFLEREVRKADAQGPQALALIASQHFNVEIGMALMNDHWVGAEFWDEAADKSLTLDSIIARSECIVVGVDGGGGDDLFGFALLGRERTTKQWLLWSHAWCQDQVFERRKSIAPKLLEFVAAGELSVVGRDFEDLSEIVALIERVKDAGLLAGVAMDIYGTAGQFVDAMADIGVSSDTKLLYAIPQGIRLNQSMLTIERKLIDRSFRHGGAALMTWAVGNCRVEATPTARRITKANAGDAKIDPVMALFDAAELMKTHPEPARKPKYQMFFVG